MQAMVNVNGVLSDAAHATISVLDHGFLYGEGVYEVLRTYEGRLFLFDRHMRRLRASASRLQLEIATPDAEFERRCVETMRAAGLGVPGADAYVRVLVTRGVGEISYDPGACGAPSIVVIAKPHVDAPASAYTDGVRVALVDVVRNHPATVNPLIKSNNLLNNALGAQEAMRRGAFEGVMRNYRGEIVECTTANIFVVRDGIVTTPPLDAGLLGGLTREFLIEVAAQHGIVIREGILHDADLIGADEAFLSSTTRELVPITRVDDHTIGTGRPGPLTQQLLQAFRDAVPAHCR